MGCLQCHGCVGSAKGCHHSCAGILRVRKSSESVSGRWFEKGKESEPHVGRFLKEPKLPTSSTLRFPHQHHYRYPEQPLWSRNLTRLQASFGYPCNKPLGEEPDQVVEEGIAHAFMEARIFLGRARYRRKISYCFFDGLSDWSAADWRWQPMDSSVGKF